MPDIGSRGINMLKAAMDKFSELIQAATANVDSGYFDVPVADYKDSIYRERVYCYELYHQLRCLWDNFEFRLNGELDKTMAPAFRNGPYPRTKPDLLVHIPGHHKCNLAVVEIKAAPGRFEKDLEKLTWFCTNFQYSYYRGIFLVFGQIKGGKEAVREKIRRAVKNGKKGENLAKVDVLYHCRVKNRAQIVAI